MTERESIIGTLPPHVTSPADRDRVPEAPDMFADIGASSAAEVERHGIHIGTVGTFEARCRMLTEELIVGRAFDDRTVCNVIIHVLERLRRSRPEHTILCAFSVQEEVGLRGTGSAAHTLDPTIALSRTRRRPTSPGFLPRRWSPSSERGRP